MMSGLIKNLKITPLVLLTLTVVLMNSPGAAQPASQVFTPDSKYTNPVWAQKHGQNKAALNRLHSSFSSKFKQSTFKFMTVNEAPVGGMGFWPSPTRMGSDKRYLCVFAKVQFPPPSTGRAFPDTQSGHILTVMDAYGKAAISMLAKELKGINDPQIAGGAIIFVYSKKPVTDPSFEQDAEALALFMPKDALLRFAELRMTIQTLFSKSDLLPILTGKSQIDTLKLYILQP
jgi:hypothetical protein